MKKSVLSTVVLVSICAVMAVLLALTNSITAPLIEKNQSAAANKALLEVMPEGQDFEQITFDPAKYPATVTEIHKETSGKGYVIKLNTTGYKPDMIIMCAVDPNGVLIGATCLSSGETNGQEKTYGAALTGKDEAGVDAVDTVAGSTKTTAAYKNAVKDAITAVKILGGAEVDVRDPEEILMENLTAALPAGEGKFTKHFFIEVVEGIDAVYTADNGKGYVYVIGEEFIAVPKDTTPTNATVAAAHAILTATTTEAVDLSAFEGINKNVTSASKTATGNYIIEIKANGYAMTGDHFYGEAKPIEIKVSMTPDGKIIDCLTVSQGESEGIGDVCANESFYGQFDGKTAEDYKQIDAISGATVTTNAYLKAIERAFEAVQILEGGAVNEG